MASSQASCPGRSNKCIRASQKQASLKDFFKASSAKSFSLDTDSTVYPKNGSAGNELVASESNTSSSTSTVGRLSFQPLEVSSDNVKCEQKTQNFQHDDSSGSDRDVPVRVRKRLKRTSFFDSESDAEDENCLPPEKFNQPTTFLAVKAGQGVTDEDDKLVISDTEKINASNASNQDVRGDHVDIEVKSEVCHEAAGSVTDGLFSDKDSDDTLRLNQSESGTTGNENLSVLDLTYSRAETVWSQLNLPPANDLQAAAQNRLSEKLNSNCSSAVSTSSQKSVASPTKTVDWVKWLQSLPIAVNSKYFYEYIDVIGSLQSIAEASESPSSYSSESAVQGYSFPSWLLPDNIRDKAGHRPDHPAYDVGTILVPLGTVNKTESRHTTPAMKQYWEFKQDHFDKIVFFKLGKFYEIFYVDAFIMNRICNLRWMGSDEKPHVGFPETGLHQYAQLLVSEGFKVVVVEQMETPKEMDERNKQVNTQGGQVKSKTIRREVCEVFSIGTLLHEDMLPTESRLLMSVVYDEKKTRFGFSYADVSTCRVWVGHWAAKLPAGSSTESSSETQTFDGILSSVTQALKTLLGQVAPMEVVIDQLNISGEALRILKQLPVPPHLNIIPLSQFRDADYFSRVKTIVGSGLHAAQVVTNVDKQNRKVLEYLEVSQEASLSFTLLSRYLEDMLLLEKVMAFARLQQVILFGDGTLVRDKQPVATVSNCSDDLNANLEEQSGSSQLSPPLIMDNVTLRHLSVLQSCDGTKNGCLLEYVDRTVTAPGARLLRRWLAFPLRVPEHIERRLDAVTWLIQHPEQREQFRSTVRQLPDVERMLTRVCTRGLQKLRGAVYFDNVHAKQFKQFIDLLDAFQTIYSSLRALVAFAEPDCNESAQLPSRLRELCSVSASDEDQSQHEQSRSYLPDVSDGFEEMKHCLKFDQETNAWTFTQHVDEEYDRAIAAINVVERSLKQYLADLISRAKQSRFWTESTLAAGIRYVHSKFQYEIEVPENHPFVKFVQSFKDAAKDITSNRIGFVRFRTSELVELVNELEELRGALKDVLYGCQQRLFQNFYQKYYDSCLRIISSLAEVDILSGFAALASSGVTASDAAPIPVAECMCRPRIISPSSSVVSTDSENASSLPILRLINSRHPLVANALPPEIPYVTNDIRLNDPDDVEGSHSFFLVTGPNMGGKSTLLRQTCLAVILAQIGSYVPATECVLTPVDRIFTRIGAYDSILERRSAFLVELEEAIPAVSNSSIYSLAVLDELGRGTSSCDGAAIALAVAEHLATSVKARCLFSTHFQLLADELAGVPSVRPVHMGIRVDPAQDSLTFLYKLMPEACSRSHGLHVAGLAGVAEAIVNAARHRAKTLHETGIRIHTLLRLEAVAKEVLNAVRDHEKITPSSWDNLRQRFAHLTKDPSTKAFLLGQQQIDAAA